MMRACAGLPVPPLPVSKPRYVNNARLQRTLAKQSKPGFDKSMREVNNSDTFAAANGDPNKYTKDSVGTLETWPFFYQFHNCSGLLTIALTAYLTYCRIT